MKKILKYIGYGFIAFVVLGIIAVASGDSKADGKPEPINKSAAPAAVAYTIADKKVTRDQIDLSIVIPERVSDKASLIEVARKLKTELGWKEKLVCWFEIQVHAETGAWASCAYLPACNECETDKDADGNPVQFMLIGMTRSLADSLQTRRLDTVENKQLVGSYLDDTWKCKTEIYRVGDKANKLLMGQVFNDGGHIVQWLTLKTVNGEKRYYFDDNGENDINYVLLDEQTKTIRYLNAQDKVWQANAFL